MSSSFTTQGSTQHFPHLCLPRLVLIVWDSTTEKIHATESDPICGVLRVTWALLSCLFRSLRILFRVHFWVWGRREYGNAQESVNFMLALISVPLLNSCTCSFSSSDIHCVPLMTFLCHGSSLSISSEDINLWC